MCSHLRTPQYTSMRVRQYMDGLCHQRLFSPDRRPYFLWHGPLCNNNLQPCNGECLHVRYNTSANGTQGPRTSLNSGGYIRIFVFIYREKQKKVSRFQKKSVNAEHKYMNISPPQWTWLRGPWYTSEITFSFVRNCTVLFSHVICCFQERQKNPDDFPPSFTKGVPEGFWWAFVSMTTVG